MTRLACVPILMAAWCLLPALLSGRGGGGGSDPARTQATSSPDFTYFSVLAGTMDVWECTATAAGPAMVQVRGHDIDPVPGVWRLHADGSIEPIGTSNDVTVVGGGRSAVAGRGPPRPWLPPPRPTPTGPRVAASRSAG